MIEGIPKISVLVITYKQEDIVGRTLDSLVSQRDYLYEICISDDCSPDGTWDVLLDYQKRYPDLIKLHRQEHNVGIFENTEYSWTMPTGDIINEIAGDDTTPDGWYKDVVEFIINNNLDYINGKFCIFGDYKAAYPNGDSFIFKDDKVLSGANLISLSLRSLISDRGVCFSRAVLAQFYNVSKGRSHIVEQAQDKQKYYFTEDTYYIPSLSNVYYTGIGVSSGLTDQLFDERIEIYNFTKSFFENIGYSYTKKDVAFMNYEIALMNYMHKKSFAQFFHLLVYFVRAIDYSLPGGGFSFKRYYFAIRRRLPHKKPISMTI